MSSFGLYCILQLDTWLVIAGILLPIMTVTLIFFTAIGWDKSLSAEDKRAITFHKRITISVLIVVSLICLFVPTTKKAVLVYTVPKIVDGVMANEELRELPGNFVELTNTWLKQQTENIKEETAE